jgi:hypothetical protein
MQASVTTSSTTASHILIILSFLIITVFILFFSFFIDLLFFLSLLAFLITILLGVCNGVVLGVPRMGAEIFILRVHGYIIILVKQDILYLFALTALMPKCCLTEIGRRGFPITAALIRGH